MKKLIIIALIVVAAAGLLYVKQHDTTTNTDMGKMDMSADMADSSDVASTPAVQTSTVAITNFKFSPAVITVKKGTTVTWTNKDSIAHTVTADSGSGPDSTSLGHGATYSYTYTKAGKYPYHCDIHEDMKGMVIVTE